MKSLSGVMPSMPLSDIMTVLGLATAPLIAVLLCADSGRVRAAHYMKKQTHQPAWRYLHRLLSSLFLLHLPIKASLLLGLRPAVTAEAAWQVLYRDRIRLLGGVFLHSMKQRRRPSMVLAVTLPPTLQLRTNAYSVYRSTRSIFSA